MHVRLPTAVRLGLPALAVLGLALAGCSDPVVPAPTAPATESSAPVPPAPSRTLTPPIGNLGSDGLTVRYLDHDGTVRTVRVEDFRH